MIPRVGVLALQGDFAAHARVLAALGADVGEVRRCGQLDALSGLVLPGGESTTLLKLMEDGPWFDALRAFHARGGALLATCAGAILVAAEVEPRQPSLGLVDMAVARNGYGRQVNSFEAEVDAIAGLAPLSGLFIRAPRIRSVGPGVEVLARLDGEPVAVRSGRVLAATFHPELAGSPGLHRLFVAVASQPPIGRAAAPQAMAPGGGSGAERTPMAGR